MKNNPAFLIDGYTEKRILERICQGKKINLINCNGKSVSIPAMAKRISSLIRLLNNKYYPIIILIDREDRTQTVEELCLELKCEILKLDIKDDVRIGVCDRMIENWILADWENFRISIGDLELEMPKDIEGLRGKSLMKKYYPSYQETTDGVNFFLNANPDVLIENSNSFRLFVQQLNDLNCYWTQTIKLKIYSDCKIFRVLIFNNLRYLDLKNVITDILNIKILICQVFLAV